MSTSLAPGAQVRWRSVRLPVIAGGVLLAVTIGLALVAAQDNTGALDPEAYDPAGSRAVAQLLAAEGVGVQVARTLAEARAGAPDATLLVTEPALVPPEALADLAAEAGAVVLISPDVEALDALDAPLRPVAAGDAERRTPQCALPAADRAGAAELGGIAYTRAYTRDGAAGEATLCYPAGTAVDDGALLARSGAVTVLGSGDPLTNERLDDAGNAALGLALLGERPTLVWFRPTPGDPGLREGGGEPLHTLLPGSVQLALAQLAIAAVVVAIWRGRRLGPVVGEPLPVIVRAAESTEGLARLYQRAGARERAATALRGAAIRTLAPRFGQQGVGPTPGPDPQALTETVARHTGRPTAEVAELLHGGAPPADHDLVRLADDLDALVAQIRVRQ